MSLVLADVVNRADVRMIQSRCRTRLSRESSQRRLVLAEIFHQKFQGDEALQTDVLGLID